MEVNQAIWSYQLEAGGLNKDTELKTAIPSLLESADGQ